MDDQFEIVVAAEAQKEKPFERAIGRKTSGFSRQDVVDALQNAFRMIGGVQRLALWANDNPTEFYRLYTKMLPSTSIALGVGAETIIQHAIPPTELDRHPGFDAPNVVPFPKRTGTE